MLSIISLKNLEKVKELRFLLKDWVELVVVHSQFTSKYLYVRIHGSTPRSIVNEQTV